MRIDSIWIETEISVGNRYDYFGRTGLAVGDVIDGIAEVDDEYYDNQVEFKTVPGIGFDKLEDFRSVIVKELAGHKRHFPYSGSPSFVGTHVHSFLSRDDGTKVTQPTRYGKRYAALRAYYHVTKFFHSWFSRLDLSPEGRVLKGENKTAWNVDVLKAELFRVLTSNNVSKFFDVRYMDNALSRNLSVLNLNYAYSSIGNDRPKYQPVIWSLARDNGKPTSLEVRLFPNAMFLLSEKEAIESAVTDVVEAVSVSDKWTAVRNRTTAPALRYAIKELHLSMCKMLCATMHTWPYDDAKKAAEEAMFWALLIDKTVREYGFDEFPGSVRDGELVFNFEPVNAWMPVEDDDSIPGDDVSDEHYEDDDYVDDEEEVTA